MGRSILAVVAGYLVVVVLVMAKEGALLAITPGSFVSPDGKPRLPERLAPWYAFELVTGFGFAVVGGYVAGAVARRAEVKHAAALAGLWVAVGGLMVAGQLLAPTGGPEPMVPAWWSLGEMASGVVGVLVGGVLRARRTAAAAAAQA